MRDRLSDRIVGFISNLFPLYEYVVIDGRAGARCLLDGTLIFAVDEEEGTEDGSVLVHWQGDPNRSSEAMGASIATIAVARYIELNAVSFDKGTKAEYARLAQHFALKTGSGLALERPDERAEAYALLDRLLDKAGVAIVVGILKKALGI